MKNLYTSYHFMIIFSFLVFSRFFRVKKIVVAAGRLRDKEKKKGEKKTFPEQEKLSYGDDNLTNIIIIHIIFFNLDERKEEKKSF